MKYREKVEELYSGGDLRAAWRGIKSIDLIYKSEFL